jgi:hypothetical protein
VYFLMKRRLSKEVNQEPPLFPWETEVNDYPEELTGDDADLLIHGHPNVEPPNNDAPGDR